MPEWQKTEEWPLASAQTMAIFMGSYVVGLKGLQWFMKKREAMPLYVLGHVHNVIMTVFSAWVFVGMGLQVLSNWRKANSDPMLLICDPEVKLSHGCDFWFWAFYVSKFYEYVDTILLILRKKDVIFLHSYHHFITASIVWAAWIFPGAGNWVGPISNAFVHIWMYLYYLLSDLVKLNKGWGKYVTKIQLIQFWGCLAGWTVIGFYLPQCNTPIESYLWLLLQYFIFLVLFLRFDKKRNSGKSDEKTTCNSFLGIIRYI